MLKAPVLKKGVNCYVRNDINDDPLSDIIIDVWRSDGSLHESTITNDNGGFSIGALTGDY